MFNDKKFLVLVLISVLLSTSLMAEEEAAGTNNTDAPEHKFEKAKAYYSECKYGSDEAFNQIKPYLKAFTDAEVMAEMMANPTEFAKLMSIVNDPRTMHVMMKCSTEPVMWDTWMRGMSDPTKMMNAAMKFMNPAVYYNWAMAPMNPQMYAPMMSFMNPQYYMNWMNASMNPQFYSPFFSMMDPNWYMPRIHWMMNPNSYAPMFGMVGTVVPQNTDSTAAE